MGRHPQLRDARRRRPGLDRPEGARRRPGEPLSDLLVDVGHGVVRARAAAVVAERALTATRPGPGRVEHAPDEIWRLVLDVVAEVAGRTGPPDALRLSADPAAVVLWDRETLGSPLPVIGGPDERAASVCERLRADGRADRVADLTGRPLDPRAAGPKLAWLAAHEERTWWSVGEGRYAVGDVASYLLARLTRGLEHHTTVALARPTLLLDVATGGWSPELAETFDVPLDALPELDDPGALTDPAALPGLEVPVSVAGSAS